MTTNVQGQVIALAAIFQCAKQVENLAKDGQTDTQLLETAVNSLFCQNPDQPIDVFGNIGHLADGLETLYETLRRKPMSQDIMRYVMGILHLQKRLLKTPAMLNTIGDRLDKIHQQSKLFTPTHENIIGNLADLYTETISTFSFRIQVMGEYQYLQQGRIANQIRVLLFAGIRAAVLWRQLGGSRIKIIFQRKQLAEICEKLLREAKQQNYIH